MLVNLILKISFVRKVVYMIGKHRAKVVENWLEGYIQEKEHIIDIGAGLCNISENLGRKNPVTPVDIKNISVADHVVPIIYDGHRLPFKDNAFDISLLCTVLHHTENPEHVLKEAQRVSQKILLVEDIYNSLFQKYLTFFADSLINLEFFGHPHTNKNDEEWKRLFELNNLTLKDARYFRVFFFFRQVVYFLEKK
ncbi:MAG: class I SAM-dependent methyltransferase [Cytophagaceae bacterium]